MRIVQVATECAPIAKAGGLGEVTFGLARELKRVGQDVEVILPKYDFISLQRLRHVNLEIPDFKCLEKGSLHANAMWAAECEGVPVRLLEARHPSGYFHRNKIYGCEDDTARFLYFSRAVLEYLKLKGKPIDILHLHDWHVAAAAVLARDLFALPVQAIVLSIHNAAYQGRCAVWDLDHIGLSGVKYLTKEKLQDDERPKLINLLKGGIVYSDAIVAVSPSYAHEILTPEFGYGLDPAFRKAKGKLTGILNGLDLSFWNPASDPHLAAPYQAGEPIEKILKAKEASRAALAKRFSLSKNNRPWIGSITRLAHQKGPELIEAGLKETVRLGGTFFLLGASPDPETRARFEPLQKEFKGKPALIHFEYDEALAHELYAALDLLILPSVYEPCGLSQMIAMRYGTIPIARATGGHKDTIFDCDNLKMPAKKQNGFLFPNYTAASAQEALARAVRHFREAPARMRELIHNGMAIDWSWEKPAGQYLDLYQSFLSR